MSTPLDADSRSSRSGMVPRQPASGDAVLDIAHAHQGITAALASASAECSDVKLTPLVALGHPVDALPEQFDSTELLVVGSRGLGRFDSMRLGSVSAALVH